jgi:sulfate transport system ATP-binding protein
VFVTHDQEEAMDVADSIAVLAAGEVVQKGTPDDLYDRPANDFVMSFLGPVTTVSGRLARPHDLEIHDIPVDGTVEATVERVVRLGFEVRVDLRIDGAAAWAQVTRGAAADLRLETGSVVFVRPAGEPAAAVLS